MKQLKRTRSGSRSGSLLSGSGSGSLLSGSRI